MRILRLEDTIRIWLDYYQRHKDNEDWKKVVKIIDTEKVRNMPFYKGAFQRSIKNGDLSFYGFGYNLSQNSEQLMGLERECNKLIKLNGCTLSEDAFIWCVFVKSYIGFVVEFEIQRALKEKGYEVEDSDKLDMENKVDLRVSKENRAIAIQIKNFSYVFGYKKYNGYGGKHIKGLLEYQQIRNNQGELIIVGFIFYILKNKDIKLCHMLGANHLIALPKEVDAYSFVGDYKTKDIKDLVELVSSYLQ